MSSTYIPDLTERFPEGLDGIDLTESYFPSGCTDEDIAWAAFEEDYRRHKEKGEVK